MRRALRNCALRKSATSVAAALLFGLVLSMAHASPGRYLEVEEFLSQALTSVPDAPDVLFVDAQLRERIESILGHRLPLLRMRYWQDDDKTVWVLDEIGKTEPITIGVVVEAGRVGSVRVLEFRESRGYEVRYPFFTDQYAGAQLAADDSIDRSIDSITGATLSVNAVDKVVRIALLCDAEIRAPEQLAGL
jgi:hypothetical protein